MQEIHIALESGKNARVALSSLKSKRQVRKKFSSTGEEVFSTKIHNGYVPDSAEKLEDWINNEGWKHGFPAPDVDVQMAGVEVGNTSKCFYKTITSGIVGDFDVTLQHESGESKPFVKRLANINTAVPVKIVKRISTTEAFSSYVFSHQKIFVHSDGLTFDFLYNLAKELGDKKQVAVLGTGSKGNLPIVFSDGGSPYRGFIYGEYKNDQYKLVLLLSSMELKLPEFVEDSD